MESIRKVFAHHLRELRGNRTQEEFSQALGMHLRSYQKLEAGNIPQKATLSHLVETLNLDSETALFADPDLKSKPTHEDAIDATISTLEAVRSIPPDILKRLAAIDWSHPNILHVLEPIELAFAKGQSQAKRKA